MTPSTAANDFMRGRALTGFRFGSGFTLYFGPRPGDRGPHGTATLQIDGPHRLDGLGDREELLGSFPISTSEPSEPLLAALLVELLWARPQAVESAVVSPAGDLVLHLEGQARLSCSVDPGVSGPDWALYSGGDGSAPKTWLLQSEAGSVEGPHVVANP